MVVRVSGVVLPLNKHLVISLQSIFGVGLKRAQIICKTVGLEFSKKVCDLTQDEVVKIQFVVNTYVVESDLRRNIVRNIKRLRDIKCYRGMRHCLSLPVRGQRTRTNASTRKRYKNKIS